MKNHGGKDLQKIKSIEDKFTELCNRFSNRYGYKTELALGWGIVRGVVKKINGDYIGANINKCARLCSIARPYGLIIERDDFPTNPSGVLYDFFSQIRKLEGISEEVNVWVTKEIFTQFIPREKKRECPEVCTLQAYVLKGKRMLFPYLLQKGMWIGHCSLSYMNAVGGSLQLRNPSRKV